jgi:hypothetical protein
MTYTEVYKPQLEEILGDIIVVAEVAEFATEADHMEDDETNEGQNPDESSQNRRASLSHARWSSLRFKKEDTHDRTCSEDSTSPEISTAPARADSLSRLPYEQRKDVASGDFSESSSSIKNFLDRWDEPASKLDKVRVSLF